ncbi:hypothetical protein ACFL3U_00450 [Pseudomonadota bacterium]
MNIKIWSCVLLILMSLNVTNVAQADPDLFPGMQPMAGMVDYIDPKTGDLVVGDMAFQLNDKTMVRKTNGAFASLATVTAGKMVTIYFDPALRVNFVPPIIVKGIELH